MLFVHIETSSLWAEFLNKNRCISVRFVSEEDKSIILIILIIHIVVCYDQNMSLHFYVKAWSHVRLRHPSCVYITTHRQYIAIQKMRTPLKYLSMHYNLESTRIPFPQFYCRPRSLHNYDFKKIIKSIKYVTAL